MMTLRWFLGVLTVAAAVFFLFLKFQLQGLFGGRPMRPAEIVLPLLAFAFRNCRAIPGSFTEPERPIPPLRPRSRHSPGTIP